MSNPHRKARRAKRYQPKPVRHPMLVGASLVMFPLQQIVNQLDLHGTVDTDSKGVAQFMATDGRWYESAPAIEGVIWHFEMMCTRHGLVLPLDGLRELHIALKYIVPIQNSTMVKLRAALPVLQRAMGLADRQDQIDLLQQTRIRAELVDLQEREKAEA